MTETEPEFIADAALIKAATSSRPNAMVIQQDTETALRALYGGTGLASYVIPYSPHEDAEKVEDRRRKTVRHYKNHVRRIANQYREGVFGSRDESVEYLSTDAGLQAHLQEEHATWWKSEVARAAMVLREIYILVESPIAVEDVPENLSARALRDSGAYAKTAVIYPQHVQNFSMDDRGKLFWVSIKVREQGQTMFKVYTESDVMLVNSKGAVLDRKPHGFLECPVIRMVYEEDYSLGGNVGAALMQEVIDLSIASLQHTSMLTEAVYASLMPQLVAGPRTVKNIAESGIGAFKVIVEGDAQRAQNDELGTTRYLNKPLNEVSRLIELEFERYPVYIQTAARLRDRQTTRELSGVSKLMDAVPEIAVINEIGSWLQYYDRWVCRLKAWVISDSVTVEVNYPTREEIGIATGVAPTKTVKVEA